MVYFKEPVTYRYFGDRFDNKTKKWEYDVECEKHADTFTFYNLRTAKKLIKANFDKYKTSCITKICANGDWENLGEIKLNGSNKTFVANTRQKQAGYI